MATIGTHKAYTGVARGVTISLQALYLPRYFLDRTMLILNMRPFIAVFLILLVFLTGCGNSTSEASSKKVAISLTLNDVDKARVQGVSSFATNAIVWIFAEGSDIPIQTIPLTWAARSTVVSLESGKTYRFDTSFRKAETELAWGSQSKNITTDTAINLGGRSIGGKLQVGKATYQASSGLVTLPIGVLGPIDNPVSLADYGEFTYKVVGGSIVSQSKLGLEVRPDAGVKGLSLEASMKVFDTKHSESVISLEPTTIDLIPLIVAQGMEFKTYIKNWPENLSITGFTVQAVRVGDKSVVVASSPLGENGEIKLSLPDAKGLEDLGVLAERDFSESLCSGATATDTRLKTTKLRIQVLGPDGQPFIVTFGQGPYGDRPNENGSFSGDQTYLQFSPSSFALNSYCYGGGTSSSSISYTFVPGWNFVRDSQYYGFYGGSSISSYSINPSKDTYSYWYTYASDASVALATNPLKPKFEPYNLVISLNGGGWFSGNISPAIIDGTISFSSSDYVYLSAGSVRIGYPDPNAYSCEWSSTVPKTLNFRCMIYSLTTVQFAIPMPTQTAQSSLSASVAINRTGWLDPNHNNNYASISSAGGIIGTPINGVDNSPPGVSVGPSVNRSRVGVETKIMGSAGDSGLGSGVARVEVFDGMELLGEATITTRVDYPDSHYATWDLPWIPTRSGGHTLRAVAYDLSGNSGVGETTIDIQPAQ